MPAELPQAYLRGLFDDYAARFDKHLTGALGYRGPRLIFSALRRACVMTERRFLFPRAIDLGCGTGLMGVALKGRVGEMTGVDLSPAMLREAAKTKCYVSLTEGDMTQALDDAREEFDLITAADALVYAGDLAPFCAAAARALTGDGLAAFSVQSRADGDFSLGPELRFSHSQSYLRRVLAAAALTPVLLEAASTRQDKGVDVPGLICVARRAP